jgi:hypothetical protein
MAVRFVSVEGAFAGTGLVSVRTFQGDSSDSVLVGFSFLNPTADATVLVRHKVGGVYSGAYQELVPVNQPNKLFQPGCLGMDGAGQEIEAQLDVAGTYRWQAIFRETYT